MAEALVEAGYKYLEDQNGYFEDGYFPVTISNAAEQRVSAAIGYLTSEVGAPKLNVVDQYARHRTIVR